MQELVIILSGSNLGDREEQLNKAHLQLLEKIGPLDMQSSVYETSPWGNTDQPHFLNRVTGFTTSLNALEVLNQLMEIEKKLGRVRTEKWSARTIDLDILYFGNEIIQEPGLTIPHPGIPSRRFTLIPLVEIYPNYVHPVSGMTQQELLSLCNDEETVTKYIFGK